MPPKRQRKGTHEASSSTAPARTRVQGTSQRRGRNLKPHEENIYNITFWDDDQRARYDVLSKRRIVPTRFLDMGLMEELGLAGDLRYLVNKVGGEIILNGPFNTYAKYVLEILSSLEVYNLSQCVEASSVNVRFRVNGVKYSLDGDEFNEMYGFHKGGERILGSFLAQCNTVEHETWYSLTGVDIYRASSAKCSLISNPVIRCFQKAIANSIFARGDSQNVCRKQELYVIRAALCPEDPIDLGYHLLKQFRDVANKTEGPICIGGMLTPILNILGVDLSAEEAEIGNMLLDRNVFIQSNLFVLHGRDIFLKHPRLRLPNPTMTTIKNRENWRLDRREVVHEESEDEEDDNDGEDDEEMEDDEENEEDDEQAQEGEGADDAFNMRDVHNSLQELREEQRRTNATLAQLETRHQRLEERFDTMYTWNEAIYHHFFPPPPPPPTE